jgi:hypothetical protein
MRKEQPWSCMDVTYRPLGHLKFSFSYLEPSLTCLAVARAMQRHQATFTFDSGIAQSRRGGQNPTWPWNSIFGSL